MAEKCVPSQVMKWTVGILLMVLCACGHDSQVWRVDEANTRAYAFHYVSLDSTYACAQKALSLSTHYEAGRMEAMNHLAFVSTAHMDYPQAENYLNTILTSTGNQVELFVANVQMMRLCQRMSRNKEFYTYYWAAERNARRLRESMGELTPRQRSRFVYADVEMKFVYSAYLYYIGQIDTFREVLQSIDIRGEVRRDTAQVLNYLYNIGSGGYFEGSTEEVSQKELSALENCYTLAVRAHQLYWQANALQAMCEHSLNEEMARRSLALFTEYGDVYQVAGAWRTLADCLFQKGKYDEAIASLEQSLLADTLIFQSPALTSSIFERLSINYSATDNKPYSDFFRNRYLDTQENTRQDRELDLRAEQLSNSATSLNLILLVLLAVVVVLFGTLYTIFRRHTDNKGQTLERRLATHDALMREKMAEERQMALLTLEHNLHINIEQRAKVTLVHSILPLINRITMETDHLKTRQESAEGKQARLEYIGELNHQINLYNDLLTEWIQLRKGALRLKIESFPLQELFDLLAKGRTTFALHGVTLNVSPTTAVVKADKALTLFMLNTMADNARKAIDSTGEVTISASETADYVELSVSDTGRGMDSDTLHSIFQRQTVDGRQHGFGLMNCKGIIEKYKKVSQLFSVCQLTAESELGRGSTFRFRLPRGVVRMVITLVMVFSSFFSLCVDAQEVSMDESKRWADSVYFCNLQGRYEDAIAYAHHTLHELNHTYRLLRPADNDTLLFVGGDELPELRWYADSVDVDYSIILDVRNETAVAALALHLWQVYSYNNVVYTRLFRELSSDHQLPAYVKKMEEVSYSKRVAIVLLLLLLLTLVLTYYFLFYRRMVRNRSVVESARQRLEEDMELARDDINRIAYESETLHVSNNVLDNCLSALKHETMYYPSKIQQILEEDSPNVDQLEEVAEYYRALFTLLSLQAESQVKTNLRIDDSLRTYLHTLLTNLFDDIEPTMTRHELDSTYELFTYSYEGNHLADEEVSTLFMPTSRNLKCRLLRQIVREMGQTTARRGCGIKAQKTENGINICMTLAKTIKYG